MIAEQPHLQLLGICHFTIHHPDDLDDFWAKINRLYQNPACHQTLPVVFMLNYDNNGITFIPSFYRHGGVLQACREIITSLIGWPNTYRQDAHHPPTAGFRALYPNVLCRHDQHGSLSISLIGISEENIGLFSEMMEALVICKQDFSTTLTKPTIDITITIHRESIQVKFHLF